MRVLVAICALAATIAPSFARDVKPGDIPAETKAEIKARCEAEWGDHQDKYSMIAYCIDTEVTAWARYRTLNDAADPQVVAILVAPNLGPRWQVLSDVNRTEGKTALGAAAQQVIVSEQRPGGAWYREAA